MEEFVDADEAYLVWIADHPDGFVLNTPRRPTASYLYLHRASCGSISGVPANGRSWTGQYVKVCADSVEELEWWARASTGGELHSCGLCHPEASGL